MILHYRLIFCTSEDNFERVKTLLRKEYGLVPPLIADEERLRRQLVWENAAGLGMFRVHFNPGQKEIRFDNPKTKEKRYLEVTNSSSEPTITFTYWDQRVDKATEEGDPMKKVYLGVYKLLRPVTVLNGGAIKDGNFVKINLESLLS